jgi:hypothetical protein
MCSAWLPRRNPDAAFSDRRSPQRSGTGAAARRSHWFEKRATFDPSAVVKPRTGRRKYSLSIFVFPQRNNAAQWVVEAFGKEGVRYDQSKRDRSAIYLDALPLFGGPRPADRASSVDASAPQSRTSHLPVRPRSRESPGGADDLANAACGVLVLVTAAAITQRCSTLTICTPVPAAAPSPLPSRCSQVFATIGIDLSGHLPLGPRRRLISICAWRIRAKAPPDRLRTPPAHHLFFFSLKARVEAARERRY